MSQIKKDLTIRSENIQRVYEYYRTHKFIVNRRYQRKLVWNLEEKRAFIDSINKGYPVPLFLLAEVEYENDDKFEIIDGMQRLNSIMSFIEQEFDYEGKYYDLEAMAETKLALDKNEILQKEPKLDRETCARIASYVLPLSVYKNKSSTELDEIFRRINSGGRLLSRQEIRQSGSTGNFATTVRKIASNIRGDVSIGDKLSLNSMKEISITNKNLSYGINVDDIFWVSQNILRREKVRESRDEELIADILGYMLTDPGSKPSSRADFIDNYYGITEKQADKDRLRMVETNLAKRTPEIVTQQFMNVYEALKKTLYEANKTFNVLINKDQTGVPRYFQAVFLAYYELLIEEDKIIQDSKKLASKLNGIGRHIHVYKGGGKWSAEDREKNIKAVKGIISTAFKNRGPNDPALNSWTTELENILM